MYTWGSEGDVRPFVALALALGRAGHDVSLAYVAVDGRDWGPVATPLGVASRSIGAVAIASARATKNESDDALAGKGNPLTQVKTVLEHLLDPACEDMWNDALDTVEGCDVVVTHLLYHPAASLALARGIPLVTVQPAPVTPTRRLPPMGAPDVGWLNGMSWWLADRLGRSWFLPRVNATRVRAGVAPVRSMFPNPNPGVALGLTCVSPTLVPRPDDWEDAQRVPGFFELPPSELGWSMPDDLAAFLAAGPPPLLMSLGSMLAVASDDTKYCVRTLVQAADLSGQRALIQAPWADLPDAPTSPNVFRLGRAPHALVLAHCTAMVHHGGAGTTHTASLAGKPSVVVPFLGDQFFWASRLRKLGIAPAPVPRKSLDAQKLAKQIRAIAADESATSRAKHIASSMQQEDGIGQAVKWITELGSLRPRSRAG